MRGILLRAVESSTLVEMIYLSKDGTISQRIIRVLEVKDQQFKGYCYLRKKYRVFNLSNILSISPLSSKYKGA